MPIYEYTCNKCKKKFEKLVLSSDNEAEFQCPSCGEKNIHRQISSFSCVSNSGESISSGSGCSPSKGFS